MSDKTAASFDEILNAKGTQYDTIEAYGIVLRLGSLSSADMLEWLSENNDSAKKERAGLRILVKALVDADGKRVPDNDRERFVDSFANKDNAENGRVIKKVLEMNGLRQPEKTIEAVKNDSREVLTETSR
jgi:hypothetical protein